MGKQFDVNVILLTPCLCFLNICSKAVTIKMFMFISTGTITYICDFHREQCWERWLRKADNGLNDKREEVLSLLRNVAKSPTEAAFDDNLKSLKTSDVWLSSPHLQNWFEKTWLVDAKVHIGPITPIYK